MATFKKDDFKVLLKKPPTYRFRKVKGVGISKLSAMKYDTRFSEKQRGL